MEGSGGGGEVRRIHVVYLLSRMGRMEQPHLFRVHHLARSGVRLKGGPYASMIIPIFFSFLIYCRLCFVFVTVVTACSLSVDVKRWLGELRGKNMPDSFSWSYKRSSFFFFFFLALLLLMFTDEKD